MGLRSLRVNCTEMTADFELLDSQGVETALKKIAEEILERHPKHKKIILVGIRTGGVFLAERLRRLIKTMTGTMIPMGKMDITLYRDDTSSGLPRPEVGSTEIPGEVEGRTVILVDDVLFTGRTVRAALVELMDFGRPKRIELAVLVDRGHRELPIRPDYVGLKVKTKRAQSTRVLLSEAGQNDRVMMFHRGVPKKI